MKSNNIFNVIVGVMATAGISLFIAGVYCESRAKKQIIQDNIPVDSTISSSMDICPKNLGNVTLEDIGWETNNPVIKSEDEYWEIEQVGNLYYRVRREDHETGYTGKYEYDAEELIGDYNDLVEYSRQNNIDLEVNPIMTE